MCVCVCVSACMGEMVCVCVCVCDCVYGRDGVCESVWERWCVSVYLR